MQYSKDKVRQVTDFLSLPTVLKGTLVNWPSRHWSPEYLASVLKGNKLKVRIGPVSAKELSSVLWEVDSAHEVATLDQFCEWLSCAKVGCSPTSTNPLLKYKREEHWCYVDYKQMAFLFEDHPEILEAVHWSDLGFTDRDGRQSTIWIGSEGAFTPGHYDTYGFNLVAQIYGRKRWHLFPPSQTQLLYPTRVPYEESSVFSPINIANPSLERYPRFAETTPYIVTLEPGDVLFVPKHWWHFVESLEVSISINTWVEVESDKESRLQEAVTRVIVSSLMSSSCDARRWLNPTETIYDEETNYRYIKAAHKELSSLNSPSTIDDSNSPESSNRAEPIQARELPRHEPNSGEDLAVHADAMSQHEPARKEVRPATDVASCPLQLDTQKVNTNFDCAAEAAQPGTETEKSSSHTENLDINPSSAGRKRCPGHTERSGSHTKLLKTDHYPSNQDQSTDILPSFIVPVQCQGQIYKESKHEPTQSGDVEPQNRDLNIQTTKSNFSVDEMRDILVECVTHPTVISLATTLLQEKLSQNL